MGQRPPLSASCRGGVTDNGDGVELNHQMVPYLYHVVKPIHDVAEKIS